VLGYLLAPELGAAAAAADNPIDWDGHRWAAFSSAEKDAYLGGFLAGAAASQAYAVLETDTVFDVEALERRLVEIRSNNGLHFRYGANLYHARLHDYYFYVDRLERPVYRVMAELNFQLQTKHY
jgi:hypothetical protein